MRRLLTASAILVMAQVATSDSAYAERYTRQVNGKTVVVHTNPLPVVVHRVLPPYLGKHVTQRSLNNGRPPRELR